MHTEDMEDILRDGEEKHGEAFTNELMDAVERLAREKDALVEALTPSAGTKAAYMGEFVIRLVEADSYGRELPARQVVVGWTTIKEIMGAIRERAANTATIAPHYSSPVEDPAFDCPTFGNPEDCFSTGRCAQLEDCKASCEDSYRQHAEESSS